MSLLDAIRSEIDAKANEHGEHCDARDRALDGIAQCVAALDRLKEMERLALELDGSEPAATGGSPAAKVAPEPPAGRRKAKVQVRSKLVPEGSRTTADGARKASEILELLKRTGPASQAEITSTVGFSKTTVARALARLEAAGSIERTGETVVGQSGGRASPVWRACIDVTVTRRAAPSNGNGNGNGNGAVAESLSDRIVHVLTEHGPRQGDDLFALLGRPEPKPLAASVHELIESSKIRKVPHAGRVYYELVP